ncbi:hypothetical protein BKA61DRAFT_611744 [Leptodontidium sp. MPI-SDFR-AT-0119]|nr:hypothetical protein BKA61DRAFT_611744 [Leptodontidium sp. MPI-SDFR-AT-0119]
MTTSLESLSEELLVRIVSFTERLSLPSLALASRTMNRLVIPELYASIDFNRASSDTGVEFLIPLTYHLLNNPDLATLVRSLSIRDVFGSVEDDLIPLDEGGDNDFRKGWPSTADLKDIDALLRGAVGDVEDIEEGKAKLFNAVRDGSDEGSIIVILISKLPNLRSLDIVGGMTNAGRELLRFFQRVAKRKAPFDRNHVLTKLSDVLVSGWDEKYPNSPDLLGAYLELPSIRRLHGYQMGNNDQTKVTEAMGALGTGSSPVEELELRASQLYGLDLDRVLKSCRNLKTFIYEVGHAWAWYPLRTSDIMNSMTAVEKTLENLVLEHSEYVTDNAEDGEDSLTAVSLANFKELRCLNISALFLGGFKQNEKADLRSIFPASLETLHITHLGDPTFCVPWIPSALQQAIEHKDLVFPGLRKLTLQGAFLSHSYRLEEIKGLVHKAKELGIKTVILAGDGTGSRSWIDSDERGWGIDEEVKWKECWGNNAFDVATFDVEWDESGIRKTKITA